jgi:hypothetical protein
MMFRKLLPTILCASLLTCAGAAVAAEPEAVFPVMPWNSPPVDAEALGELRACGFTVAGFVPASGLDACQAAGLKAIVSDPRCSDYDWANVDGAAARVRVAELVGQVRNHPAVYGYYLRDEPTAAWFPGLTEVSDAVRELHPGAWPYINLFPNYASAEQLGAASYDEYVERFVTTCRPTALCYDNYSLLPGTDLRPEYFTNLEAMRRAAVKHELPFWNIILATAHFNYREPTAADIAFQVYTSLAYGARGISYFTYFTPGHGNFRGGPVDQFGHKTPAWDRVRHVNLQIEKLAPTLLKLQSERVYHFGDVPAGCNGADAESLVAALEGPMLVGEFTHENGSRYVLAVNRDVAASHACSPQWRRPPAKVERVSPYTGALSAFVGENVWLGPGDGALLKVTW